MEIANPQQFLNQLDKSTYKNIEKKFAKIDRFLGPSDTFKFTCEKRGDCCYNRHKDPIILSVYDVFRLRQYFKVSGKEFAEKYGGAMLGSHSRLPLMVLLNEWIDNATNRSHCIFLKSNECIVYQNRPHVCRMYPVGRISDRENQSYFFLTHTQGCCRSGQGKEQTIEEWLDKAEVEPFLKWNDKFNSLFLRIDHKKYKSLPDEYKYVFGDILYDIGSPLENIIGPEKYSHISKLEDESLLEATHQLASQYVDIFFK